MRSSMRNDLRLADRHTPEHGSLSERAHEVPIDAFEDMRSTIEIHRPEGSGNGFNVSDFASLVALSLNQNNRIEF